MDESGDVPALQRRLATDLQFGAERDGCVIDYGHIRFESSVRTADMFVSDAAALMIEAPVVARFTPLAEQIGQAVLDVLPRWLKLRWFR